MSFVEKSLQCSDCSTSFTFSVEEQEFFAKKGTPTSPSGAHPAVKRKEGSAAVVAVAAEDQLTVRCSLPCVPRVALRHRCPLSREKADQCIAAVATTKSGQVTSGNLAKTR